MKAFRMSVGGKHGLFESANRALIGLVLASLIPGAAAMAGDLTLAKGGAAQCVIVAPAGWTNAVALPDGLPSQAVGILKARRDLYRDSVKDLALYLGKMSGAKIEIVEGLPAGDGRVPIYIGSEAQKVFGPVGKSKAGLFAFRVVAGRKGVGLYGEAEYGTSYAIYELLHRLGCRWFMPTEIGEVVPERPTLSVPAMDLSLAPATEGRGMWQGGADWLRRNRMNGDGIVWLYEAQGAVEDWYITAEQRKAHPEWCLQVNGNPHPIFLRWTRQDVADAMAENIIRKIETTYAPVLEAGMRLGFGFVPRDNVVPADDPEEMKADPVPRVWDPAAGRWSVTDRYILLANRVAERVTKKYPDVLFRAMAYVNVSMPPVLHTVHPNIEVQIAPIDFNRHHPMSWTNHPNEYWLRDMVEGWARQATRLNAYWYGMNLAELSAPNPFITKWGTDIPILLENHLTVWGPETMGGWESMMPGYYLAARMTFHAHETAEEILDDLWRNFYGSAAEPMARYWHRMDRAWIDANEYAGAHWGYLRIFTPEVLEGARADINEALAKCRTIPEYHRRVTLIDESLALFENYMKMRRDWAAGNLRNLESDYDTWRSGIVDMVRRYRDPADPTYVQGRAGTLGYPDSFIGGSYKDASRMERDFTRHGRPMLEWKWRHNPLLDFDGMAWTAPDFNDSDWPVTHVVRETWSTIGHHNTMTDSASGRSGRMAYRASQKLAAVPEGKKVFLWIGATDGSAKVFVNGTHIPYIVRNATRHHEAGAKLERFDGYCVPTGTGFDVTTALKEGDNQFTILCDRHNLNELGTGGLMGPVVIYREK